MTMVGQKRILPILFAYVAAFNRDQPPDGRLAADAGTILMGEGGVLDSFALVAFLAGLEQNLSNSLGVPVVILDETLAEGGENHAATLGTLADHLDSMLRDHLHRIP